MPKKRSPARRDAVPVKREAGDLQERLIVVMFVDIVGCSEISNHKTLGEYNRFLAEFHSTFCKVIDEYRSLFYLEHERQYVQSTVRGDEGCLMIFVPPSDPLSPNLSDDVDTAVNVALDLKRRWLLSQDNRRRIAEAGLLPTELAIGIHLGKAFVNDLGLDAPLRYNPEGYAINLTKRIEGYSREGSFARIFLSEAARGELYMLRDEDTYTLFGPQMFRPRGISRDIRVYEVKHHFLPTDWADLQGPEPRTKALPFDAKEEDVEIVRLAHLSNPTNIWLAEEYILLSMQHHRSKLGAQYEDRTKVRQAYEDILHVARRLTSGEQRDAGLLTICGFIVGEFGEYAEEQKYYREALTLNPHYEEAYWYLGYSMSCDLNEKLIRDGRGQVPLEGLNAEEQKQVDEILSSYKRATELKPRQAWMHYDLACELARWEKVAEAVKELELSSSLNGAVLYHASEEPYLQGIRNEPRVRRLLERTH
jgi:class 3 adenylate cyclase